MGSLRDVVTGAASGIGESTVREMVHEGADVMLADIADGPGRELADELGDRAWFHHCDVSREDEIAALVAAAVDKHGRLDCMFNNAP